MGVSKLLVGATARDKKALAVFTRAEQLCAAVDCSLFGVYPSERHPGLVYYVSRGAYHRVTENTAAREYLTQNLLASQASTSQSLYGDPLHGPVATTRYPVPLNPRQK